jgi:peptidyl-prolyl cis-trans isomerase B (cyclophilin B)
LAQPRRLLVALAVLALAGCGGSKHAAAPPPAPKGGCATVAAPAAKARSESKPTTALDPAKTYDVTFQTNCGSFTVRLDVKTSPKTSASFVSLVQHKFFDGTVFHRIVPGFVIQGGDPTASGSGGPGYETVDTPPKTAAYTHGVVAMAKTQSEAPGTSGSQFFVVTAANAGLPPDYAILGRVVKGIGVVDRIGKLGDVNTEKPTRVVEIEHATVSSS